MTDHHVCPWWIGYLLASPLRKLLQNPERILQTIVRQGDTFLDVGCAMGFFTIPAVDLVGPEGRVIAIDLQERMLTALSRRARRRGIQNRIETRRCSADSLGIDDLHRQVDSVLAFAVVHEVPCSKSFFREIYSVLHTGGRVLVAEPAGHVSRREFEDTLKQAGELGLEIVERPKIRRSLAVLLRREHDETGGGDDSAI